MGQQNPSITMDAGLGPNMIDISKHLYALFSPEFIQAYPDAQIEIAYGLPERGPEAARLFSAVGGMEAAAAFAYARSQARLNVYVGPVARIGGIKSNRRASKADLLITNHAWCDFDGEGDEERVTSLLRTAAIRPQVMVQTGTVPWSRFQLFFRLDRPMSPAEIEPINAALQKWLGGDPVQNADRVMRLAGTLSFPNPDKVGRGYVVECPKLVLTYTERGYSAGQLLQAAGVQANSQLAQARLIGEQQHPAGNGHDHTSPYLAYAASTEIPRAGRADAELMALLGATRVAHQWHNNMRAVIATLVGRGWEEMAIRALVAPYCDRGADDPDLTPLLRGAYGKGWGEAATHEERSYPSERTGNDAKHNRPFVQAPPAPVWEPPSWLDMSNWDHEEPPEREWAIEDRVPLHQAGLFSGEGGTGKSIIELMKDVAHASARDWMGSQPAPGGAFYVGAEDDKGELHIRLAAILKHYGLTFAEVIAGGLRILPLLGEDAVLCALNPRSGRIERTRLFDWLLEMAGDLKPKNISLDTLSRTYAGSEIDRAQVYEYSMHMQALAKAAGGSVTILSHPSQAGKASGDGYSGSTAWHGAFRFRQYLTTPKIEADQDPDTAAQQSAMRELQFKKNQYGPLGASIVLEYRDGLFLPVHGQSGLDKLAQRERARALFLELLDRFDRQGVRVSHKSTSRTNAPRLFAETPEAARAKVRKADFVVAMSELFAAEALTVKRYQGSNRSTEYEQLVRTRNG